VDLDLDLDLDLIRPKREDHRCTCLFCVCLWIVLWASHYRRCHLQPSSVGRCNRPPILRTLHGLSIRRAPSSSTRQEKETLSLDQIIPSSSSPSLSEEREANR